MSITLKLINLNSDFFKKSKNYECVNTSIGNILFQICYGLILAWENNVNFYCPDIEEWCKSNNLKKEDTIWRNVDTKKVSYKHNLKEIELEQGKSLFLKSFDKELKKKLFNEGIFMHGYFHKYENPYKLHKFFGPNEKDLKYISSKYSKYLDTNCCSIHFRRGKDFIELAEKYNEGFLLKNEYYIKAIEHFKKSINYFLVFSDNMQYCKNFLENYYKGKNIKFIFIRERDYIDLWIMSLCKNNIISNSTLSVWGALLNPKKEGIVIAPSRTWQFEDKKKNIRNKNKIYRKDWIVMDDN